MLYLTIIALVNGWNQKKIILSEVTPTQKRMNMACMHLYVDISSQVSDNQSMVRRHREANYKGKDWGGHMDLHGRGK